MASCGTYKYQIIRWILLSVLRHSDIVLFIQIANDEEGLKYEEIRMREQFPYSETYDEVSLMEKKTNNEPKILEKLFIK